MPLSLSATALEVAGGADNYLNLTGASGSGARTPDSVALSTTGDIDVRLDVTATDWTPAATKAFAAKWLPSSQQSWLFVLDTTGKLNFRYTTDGSSSNSILSSVATGFDDGSRHWVRVTFQANNGAAGHTTKFYTSDDGSTWTQLGSTQTSGGTVTVFDSTASVEVGSDNNTVSGNFDGKVFRTVIYSDITSSTKIVDVTWSSGVTTDTQGNTWTVVSPATEVGIVRNVSLHPTATDTASGTDVLTTLVRRSDSDTASGTDVPDDPVLTLVQFDTWRPLLMSDNSMLLVCRTPVGEHDTPTGFTHMELWTFASDGSGEYPAMLQPTTVDPSWTQYGHPEWNDTNGLAMWQDDTTTSNILNVFPDFVTDTQCKFDSWSVLQTVTLPDVLRDPSWNSDGSLITCVDCVGGTYHLATMNGADGSDYTQILTSANELADPMYSPTGTYILYAEKVSGAGTYGHWALKCVAAAGGTPTTILNDGNANMHATWIDSFQITFQRYRYGTDSTFNIWRCTLSGGSLTLLNEGEYPRAVAL